MALGDLPMGRYDVKVIITRYEDEALLEWTVSGTIQPPIRHLYSYRLEPHSSVAAVTAYYDWSQIDDRSARQTLSGDPGSRPASDARHPRAHRRTASRGCDGLTAPGRESVTVRGHPPRLAFKAQR
ncbi:MULTISPECIES: hypothetical protein [unclassified Streptomyces]|uniref:hypothetical protein n=1 Tax=unclassified Streptomyces TaxID=2593676 RepID=UPI000DBA692D|nr:MULTISPECIES: hypothetical protein [unclassified Streptomyces]MYT73772.1 hypothetical protein [Streptomyces sp. SID8367]RAJ69460.1 hypothetical protein K377_08064 [Streptomyces sp. PsTaAH-137]